MEVILLLSYVLLIKTTIITIYQGKIFLGKSVSPQGSVGEIMDFSYAVMPS